MNFWPIALAASKLKEYQFVVVPDFITDVAHLSRLRDSFELVGDDPSKVYSVVVESGDLGTLACAYRVGPSNVQGNQRDAFGRVLLEVRGIVSRTVPPPGSDGSVLDALKSVDSYLSASLQSFANATDWRPVRAPPIDAKIIQPSPKANALLSGLVLPVALGIAVFAFALLQLQMWQLTNKLTKIEQQIKPLGERSSATPTEPSTPSNTSTNPPETSEGLKEPLNEPHPKSKR